VQDTTNSDVFNFGDSFTSLPASTTSLTAQPTSADSADALLQALAAAGEAAYIWDITSDEITWSNNTADILGCSVESVANGRLYANLLDPENLTTRYETVMNARNQDQGQGVRFQVEYVFRAEGRKSPTSMRLEDTGRWFSGDDGTPKRVAGTVRRVDERHNRDQHLSFLGNADPLTGMMNRGRMTEVLSEAIASGVKSGTKCVFAIAAIRQLNLVNDAYGFDVADEVIVAVGKRLRQVMRLGDGIARFSGSKFGIILNSCSEKELDSALARFMATIRDSVIETKHGPVWSTISIGAAMLPDHGNTAALAIAHAEEALSDAARMPSEEALVYQRSERRDADRAFNTRCAVELVKCLREDSFRLAYQPIVDAKTHLPIMHEGLLRVRQGQGQELLQATHLIPLAERLGLVRLIDRAVLQLMIKELSSNKDLRLNMNVSSATVTDRFWNDQLFDVLKSNAPEASRLTFEISESVAMSNLKTTCLFVERLREAGSSVALEHFGKNFAAIRHFSELPINILKLDGSLCKNATANPENEYLLKTMIGLADKFCIKTVAEWIENQPTADTLTSWGIDFLQGHYFGAPVVADDWAGRDTATFDISALNAPMSVQMLDTAPVEETVAIPAIKAPQTIEPITHVVPEERVASVPEAKSDGEVELDFSSLDDSIAKLREALGGLTAASERKDDDHQSTEAA